MTEPTTARLLWHRLRWAVSLRYRLRCFCNHVQFWADQCERKGTDEWITYDYILSKMRECRLAP